MKNLKPLYLHISFFFFVLLTVSCEARDRYQKTEGMIWNTLYHVTFKGPENLKDSIIPVLNDVAHSLSVFDKNSLVAKLNSFDSVEADDHLLKVYDESIRIYNLSEGRFDPTLGPLIDAWGFGVGHSPSVDTLKVDSVRAFVGLGKTARKGDYIVKTDSRTRFNFSAIAKVYGCDAVGEMLCRNGVENYMVEIGGEIALQGKSPAGEEWKIGIDAPVENAEPGKETALIIQLTDCGLATSGNYRNFRDENGVRTAHTISVLTGRPFLSEILSATIVAPSAMEADAIATACMAGTLDDAKNLLKLSQVEGLLILQDSVFMSPGFANLVTQ